MRKSYQNSIFSPFACRFLLALIITQFAFFALRANSNINKVDSLKALASGASSVEKVQFFNDIARLYWYISIDSSRRYALSALELSLKDGFVVEQAKALNNLGVIADIQGDYGEALVNYIKIIDLAIEYGVFLPEVSSDFFLNIGRNHENLAAKSATRIADESPKKRLDNENQSVLLRVLANTYVNIGIVCGRLSQYEKSLVSFRQSLTIRETIEDERGVGVVLFNIGTVYLKLSNYSLAKASYLESIAIRKKYNDPQGIANGYLALGELYSTQSILDSALYYLTLAKEAFENLNNKNGLAQVYSFLGDVYNQSQRPIEAIDFLRKSLVLRRELGNREGIAITNIKLGRVFENLNEWGNAHAAFDVANSIGNELGSNEIVADALAGKARVFEKQGQISQAYSFFKIYHSVFDSIKNEKYNSTIAEFQTLYQVDQKERENSLLKKDNEINLLKLKKQKTLQSLLFILVLVILFSGISLMIMYRSLLSANRKLMVLNSELENRVNEKTKDLKEALKIAEEANNLKNSFLSNISHEIRTPLNGIMGFSSLIGEEVEDTSDVKRYVSEIKNSGNRLMHLLNNLIDISRAESNNFKMRLVSSNINQAINNSVDTSFEKGANPNVTVSKNLGPLPNILADKDNLARIFSIVVNNAIKYTEKGSVSISSKYNEAKGMIEVSVVDTGVGIEPDYLPFIFEPFRQESSGLTRSYQGAGLGLPLAKRLIELMGGSIEVTSRKGIGTVVTLSFVAQQPEETDRTSHVHDIASSEEIVPKMRAKKAKVLIIEENSYTRFYLQALLRRYVQIAVARDGSEALSLISDSVNYGIMYDMIIVDTNLPEPWNPASLITEIHARKQEYKKKPFIIQAESYSSVDKKLYKSYGYIELISKPIDKDKLLELLATFNPTKQGTKD